MELGQKSSRDRPFVPSRPGSQAIQLVATHCPACDAMMFPPQASCGRCGSEAVEDCPVGPRGTLWSYTVQTFRPPGPPYVIDDAQAFAEFGVGMIALERGLLVHARLTEADRTKLAVGQTFEAVMQTLPQAGGGEIETYAFRPVVMEIAG